MIRNSGGLARWISPGDSRPSARCGNVAVVALSLLVNRKMCFYGVWYAGNFKGLKPEIVWWPAKLIQNHWTREPTPKSSWMLSFCWWNRCCVPSFASTFRKAIPDHSSQVLIRYNMLNDCTISEQRHFKTSSYLPCVSPKQHCVTALFIAERRVAEGST